MAIFAFSVSGEYSCQSEFIIIPPLKLRWRRLNVLEVHGITASRKIHRWTNTKITYYLAQVKDNWFNFFFNLVSLNKNIACVEQGNSRLYLERN